MWMALLVATVFGAGDAGVPVATLEPIAKIVEAESCFVFSDGSSYFQFRKDGTFRLDPAGLSGRTIEGIWRQGDAGQFTVVGRWSWMNGLSPENDFRRMKLRVTRLPGVPEKPKGSDHKLYPVYHVVDEVVPLSPEDYRKATKPSGG